MILRLRAVALPDPIFQASFDVWTTSSATLTPTRQEATEQGVWGSGIFTTALTSVTSKVTMA